MYIYLTKFDILLLFVSNWISFPVIIQVEFISQLREALLAKVFTLACAWDSKNFISDSKNWALLSATAVVPLNMDFYI